MLVPPAQSVVAPAVKLGVPTLGVTVTIRLAVVFEPQVPAAVATTVKLPVTLLTMPVAGSMLAPVPFKMLYVMDVELLAVAV